MTRTRRLVALLAAATVIVAACSGGGDADNLYDKVKSAGKIVMSTDPQYPPQSELTADGQLVLTVGNPGRLKEPLVQGIGIGDVRHAIQIVVG